MKKMYCNNIKGDDTDIARLIKENKTLKDEKLKLQRQVYHL